MIVKSTACLALLFVAAFSTVAGAQNINNILNMFGTLMQQAVLERLRVEWTKVLQPELNCIEQTLQAQGDSTTHLIQQGLAPSDARLSSLRRGCRVALAPPVAPPPSPAPEAQRPATLSATPTFDCSTAKSPSGRILCLDPEGARADWDLTSAYRALKYSLPEGARSKFEKAHDNWPATLNQSCKLRASQEAFSVAQRQCVLSAFRKRAQAYRSRLSGGALAEASLSPEQHVQIQQALISMNLLSGEADGEFGELTRAAINRYQLQSGFGESVFLSPEQQAALLRNSTTAQLAPNQQPESRPAIDPQTQCGSQDANARLVGCTKIIDAKGSGYELSVADALDGRCWAYNALQQYERGLADCKASIAIKPKSFYAYNNMGTALLGLKDIPSALAAFSKAIELKPNFMFPYLGRGKAFLASGNKELAKLDFEHVLSIDSTNRDASEGLAAVENLSSPSTPPVQATQNETKKIKQGRAFLNDVREFIAAQTSPPDNITAIANEAANLQLAIDRFDEDAAVRSMSSLSNILKPLTGFSSFMEQRVVEQQRQDARRLADAKTEGTKQIFFVDNYIKEHLGDTKTAQLLGFRAQIDQAIKSDDVSEINQRIAALRA
jgi:tetratricopeptide (TPR) repeat protein